MKPSPSPPPSPADRDGGTHRASRPPTAAGETEFRRPRPSNDDDDRRHLRPHLRLRRPTASAWALPLALAFASLDAAYVWRIVERDLSLSPSPPPRGGGGRWRPGDAVFASPRKKVAATTFAPPANDTKRQFASADVESAAVDDGRHFAADVLARAGVGPLPPSVVSQLPSRDDIVSQYGPAPVMLNFESCPAYRASVPLAERSVGVAGLFNTGTNFLADALHRNCIVEGQEGVGGGRRPRRKEGGGGSKAEFGKTGMLYQVPWGKHNPPSTHRLTNVAKAYSVGVNQTSVLPVVIVKDPYHWANSQCRHKYMMQWEHDLDHCPNIVSWKSGKPTSVSVTYAKHETRYETFAGMWNGWYSEYIAEASEYPVVYVRFEDLLFQTERVVDKICKCAGGTRPPSNSSSGGGERSEFRYPDADVKDVGDKKVSNDLISSVVRYGDPSKRLEGWRYDDWEYARDKLDGNLMDLFGYTRPPWLEDGAPS